MTQKVITFKTLGGFTRGLSGLFMSKDNPNGLSPKECFVVCTLLSILLRKHSKVVTKEVKIELANNLNQSVQVVTNYLVKLRKKGVIDKDETLHQVFFTDKLTIQYGGEKIL